MLFSCHYEIQGDLFSDLDMNTQDTAPVASVASSGYINTWLEKYEGWQTRYERAISKGKQYSLMGEQDSTYRSGVASIGDLKGYIKAKKSLCVVATDLSRNARVTLAQYVNEEDGKVLLDSGAFGHFKKQLKKPELAPLDFGQVLSAYHAFVGLIHLDKRHNIIAITPDVVGDQVATLHLLKRYRSDIDALIGQSICLMTPLQRSNDVSISEFYEQVRTVIPIPDSQHVVGVPANAEAVPPAEIISLCDTYTPRHIHFLGATSDVLHEHIRNNHQSIIVTSDATRMRGQLGMYRHLTQVHHQLIDDELLFKFDHADAIDDLSNFISLLSKSQRGQFEKQLYLPVGYFSRAINTMENDEIWEDMLKQGISDQQFVLAFYELHRKIISPTNRVNAIAHCAEYNII